MVRGAFARLEHDHHFAEAPGGGTLMRDVFEFAVPAAWLGVLAGRLVLTRYLRRFLVARNETIARVAESEAWRAFLEATRPGP
jgi:ligand-binding SRPBCC domain-containing protein